MLPVRDKIIRWFRGGVRVDPHPHRQPQRTQRRLQQLAGTDSAAGSGAEEERREKILSRKRAMKAAEVR